MNGTASTAVVGRGLVLGYGGCKPPFTPVQWQELEKQTMIYKYLMAGLTVPSDLVRPIPLGFAPYSALGCLSYYGKKFDPEPGRCRRTDGKKWRCSKEAYLESKYCERHMYRSKNRSRKPVESQPTSQSLSTGHCSSSRSSQDMPLCSVSSEESSFWSNVTKLQMRPASHGIDNIESSYFMPAPETEEHSFCQEASAKVGSLGLCSTSSIQESFSSLQGNSWAKQYIPWGFDQINGSFSNQHQHNFFGSDTASPAAVKQGKHPVHPFFSEWPATRESWSNLDDDKSNHNVSSSTQLSISISRASSDLPSGIAYSKVGESSKRNL